MATPARQTVPVSNRSARRVLFWVAGAILAVLVLLFIAGQVVAHRAGPMLKAKVVQELSKRFDSRVELDTFHVELTPVVRVSGSGLRLYPRRLPSQYPLIAVKDFSFSTHWSELMRSPLYINRIHVGRLDLHLPPKPERAQAEAGNDRKSKPGGGSEFKVIVREIDSDNATLVIENGKPGKPPLKFDIVSLRLSSVRPEQPMSFQATLVNPKPIGNIAAAGSFGPFKVDDPGGSPVSGRYSFTNADLGTLKGIAGTLSSKGKYSGTLDKIAVDGETATPDFRLDVSGHPLPLNTTFHAIVDGINGDTLLQPVDAWLLHSHIVARGDVVESINPPGHRIQLDVALGPARIQDILELGSKTGQPLLTGAMRMRAGFDLPPGPAPAMDRLRLKGSFQVLNTRFTDPRFQSKVDQMSLRGMGKAKLAGEESKAEKSGSQPGAETNVASAISGQFTLGGGSISLRDLGFRAPGAAIVLNGDYTLQGGQMSFTGKARLDAKVSQMVTGWQSWLLKPLDPIFSKGHGTTVIPIGISGTRKKPHFDIKFH